MPQPQLIVNINEGRLSPNISTAGSVIGYIGYGTCVNTRDYNTPRVLNNISQLNAFLMASGSGEAYKDLSDIFGLVGSAPIYAMIIDPTYNADHTWENFTGAGGMSTESELRISKLIDFSIANAQVGSIDLLAIGLYEQSALPLLNGLNYPEPLYDRASSTEPVNGLRGGLDSVALTSLNSLAKSYQKIHNPFQMFVGVYPIVYSDYTALASKPSYYNSDSRFISLFASSTDTTLRKRTSIGLFTGYVATKTIGSSLAETREGAQILPNASPVFFNSLGSKHVDAYVGADVNEKADGLSIADTFSNYDSISRTGLLILIRYSNLAGFYINQNDTLTTDRDVLTRRVSHSRVLNIVQILSATYLLRYLDTRLRTTPAGLIDPATRGAIEDSFSGVFSSLVDQLNVNAVSIRIDPNQNLSNTNKLSITLLIQPVAYAETIELDLALTTTI